MIPKGADHGQRGNGFTDLGRARSIRLSCGQTIPLSGELVDRIVGLDHSPGSAHSPQLLSQDCPACAIRAEQLKHILRQIQLGRDNLRHDRPTLRINANTPWHPDAVGWQSEHQSRRADDNDDPLSFPASRCLAGRLKWSLRGAVPRVGTEPVTPSRAGVRCRRGSAQAALHAMTPRRETKCRACRRST